MMIALICMFACPGEEEPGFTQSSSPVEDCEDGADNDLDGLTDCEDADCIDAVHCVYEGAVLEVQITGGERLVYDRIFVRKDWESSITLGVYGVYGNVSVLLNSETTSCDWSFESGHGSVVWNPSQTWGDDIEDVVVDRVGWTIDAACPFESDHILPPIAIGIGSVLTYGSVPWYVGDGTSWFSSTKYYEAVAYGNVVGWAQSHWTLEPLEEGGVHDFEIE